MPRAHISNELSVDLVFGGSSRRIESGKEKLEKAPTWADLERWREQSMPGDCHRGGTGGRGEGAVACTRGLGGVEVIALLSRVSSPLLARTEPVHVARAEAAHAHAVPARGLGKGGGAAGEALAAQGGGGGAGGRRRERGRRPPHPEQPL